MSRLEHETGELFDLGPARVEHRAVHMGHCSAFVTHQVKGVVAGEVVDGASMSEVNVLHQPQVGQRIEGAVDGRFVDRWVGSGDLSGQIVGCRVIVHREKGFDHGPPWFGEAASGSAQSSEDVIDGPGHARTVHLH